MPTRPVLPLFPHQAGLRLSLSRATERAARARLAREIRRTPLPSGPDFEARCSRVCHLVSILAWKEGREAPFDLEIRLRRHRMSHGSGWPVMEITPASLDADGEEAVTCFPTDPDFLAGPKGFAGDTFLRLVFQLLCPGSRDVLGLHAFLRFPAYVARHDHPDWHRDRAGIDDFRALLTDPEITFLDDSLHFLVLREEITPQRGSAHERACLKRLLATRFPSAAARPQRQDPG